MTYSLRNYAQMVSDRLRLSAIRGAMAEHIGSETVVLDLGAGAGFLSLLACGLGARKVYAIDTNPLIGLLPRAARRNGWEDRVSTFCADSRVVELPEKVDLIVADIRGSLPVLSGTLGIMSDACARFLKPGGLVLPVRDEIYVIPVSEHAHYNSGLRYWRQTDLCADLSVYEELDRGCIIRSVAGPGDVLGPPARWGHTEIGAKSRMINHESLDLTIERAGRLDGFMLWFDLDFGNGVRLSNALGGHELVYGRSTFLLSTPIQVVEGSLVRLKLAMFTTADREYWRWSGEVSCPAGSVIATFDESSLKGLLHRFPRSR